MLLVSLRMWWCLLNQFSYFLRCVLKSLDSVAVFFIEKGSNGERKGLAKQAAQKRAGSGIREYHWVSLTLGLYVTQLLLVGKSVGLSLSTCFWCIVFDWSWFGEADKRKAEDRYYTDDAPGLRVTPNTVLTTSLSYVGIVVVLHIFSKMLTPA